MRLKWMGHACFLITLESGRRIIIDPYDDSVGYSHLDEDADILLVSHDHYDHNYTDGVRGEYMLVNTPGKTVLDDITITGFELFHDECSGAKRGKVIAFLINADGVNVLHMSDIGVMPEDSFFDALPDIDLLMIPVGGVYTVDAKEALAIINRMQPNITVPMHYMTTSLQFALQGVHEFEQLACRDYDIARRGHSEIGVEHKQKKRPRIVLLQHSN